MMEPWLGSRASAGILKTIAGASSGHATADRAGAPLGTLMGKGITMSEPRYTIRKCVSDDIPAMRRTQSRSMRILGRAWYPDHVIAALLAEVGTMQDAVVAEGHSFVAEDDSGHILGTGGWSRLVPGYARGLDDVAALARPPAHIATVRSVFVEPAVARHGIGTAIMRQIEWDAAASGIACLRLTATLSGEPLYAVLGYRSTGYGALSLAGGTLSLGTVDMQKAIAQSLAA